MKFVGLTLFFFLLLYSLCGCVNNGGRSQAERGFLDLSGWNPEGGIVHLDGQWEFYWQRLLAPGDFRDSHSPSDYFSVPGYWNGHAADGLSLPGVGYATFRLKVRLPPGCPVLSVRIEDQSTAYRLWVNGVEVTANGVVGRDAASTKPGYRISTADLPTGVDHLDFVLQVSNFHMAKGGPYRRIALGTSAAVEQRQIRLFAVDLLLFGMLGVIGVYHLVFYLLRRKDPSLVSFGFFCLSWCAGIPFGSVGGRFITLVFPDFPWYWLSRMELLTWFPIVPLFLMFFASLFPLEFSSKVTRFSQVFAAGFFAYVLVAPSRMVSVTEIPYQVFSLGIIAYICLCLYRAVRNRRSEAALLLAGFLFCLGTVVNDILYMNLVIYSIYLVSVGIALMILFQSFALAKRFARSFFAVESLTAELEEKNLALSRLDKLKDEFLANTSHELRTPLNGIVGIAESLISGVTGRLSEKTRHNLSMIVSSGKRLAGLINDILDVSRLRNRDVSLRRQLVDFRTLTDTVLTVMQPLAHGRPLSLHNDVPGDLPPAVGDEDRLQQILYNLIGNAVKFTEQGAVRVSACDKGSFIEVAVSDTGIGIPEEKRDDIFQPFKQADASDGRIHGGAGLGLSITRQLVELHGGTILVDSERGSGSTFRFTLPVSQSGNERLPVPESFAEIAPKVHPDVLIVVDKPEDSLPGFDSKVTILAVDDDPVNLQVVANYLAYNNVTVMTAATGRQAIGMIEGGARPDLVLLDIMMPYMTGYDVCRWLRQRYTPSELPVIMLTAKSASGDLVQGFALGANDYLVKPFVRDELIPRVVSQLKLMQSYLTLRENMALRRELEERKQSERELRVLQRQLSSMLDSVDEALLAVNESEEITFCNHVAEKLLGFRTDDLLGRLFRDVVRLESADAGSTDRHAEIRELFRSGGNLDIGTATLPNSAGKGCGVHIYLSLLDIEEDPVCLMIIRQAGHFSGPNVLKDVPQSLAVVEAINRNRARLQSIQSSLHGCWPLSEELKPGFLKELTTIDEALDNASRRLLNQEHFASNRHLAVEVMTCSLAYWTQCTGSTKADLARQSKLWRIYTNQDGWERTQTLDRYLQIETFPRRPLWIKVLKTADYVLATGNIDSPLRARLEVLLTQLRAPK